MTLGQVIRDARIAAHLSIEQLSDMTSVRIGLLTEMEENNFSHCGGDTYARGHLRNIANKVGVDPNVFIKLYNEEHSLENRAIGDLLVENNVMSVPVEKKSISWKVPAAISLSVLFLFGVIQIVMSNQSSDSQPVAAASATPTPEASVAPTPTEPSTPAPTRNLAMISRFSTQAALMEDFIRAFTTNKRTHGARNGPGKANQDPDTMAASRSELLQSQRTESIWQ